MSGARPGLCGSGGIFPTHPFFLRGQARKVFVEFRFLVVLSFLELELEPPLRPTLLLAGRAIYKCAPARGRFWRRHPV